MQISSWNVLYYRLRANFDELTSSYCTEAPVEWDAVGKTVYSQGKRATEIQVITVS